MRFRAGQRLKRQGDFQHVRTQGRRFDCGAFVFWHAPRRPLPLPAPKAAETGDNTATIDSPPCPARVGVVASRAAVGNAVERARAKRRLREIFRLHQDLVPAGLDVLLVARRSLNTQLFTDVEKRFVGACRKLFAVRSE